MDRTNDAEQWEDPEAMAVDLAVHGGTPSMGPLRITLAGRAEISASAALNGAAWLTRATEHERPERCGQQEWCHTEADVLLGAALIEVASGSAGAASRCYPGGRRGRSHARGRLDLVHTGHLASPNGAPAFTRIGGANTPGAAPRCSSRATIREAPVDTPGDPIAVVVQLAQSGRSPLRCASRLRIAWIVSIGGARCSRQLATQPSGQAVIADNQCLWDAYQVSAGFVLRCESGGRFDGSAFEQVGSGPFREPDVGAGAGEVDGHLLCESRDLG